MRPLISILVVSAAVAAARQPSAATVGCVQADTRIAKTAHVSDVVQITGAGSIDDPGGGTRFIWTGTDCIAWVIARPSITVASDERSVTLALGGRFVAHEESPTGTREYSVDKTGLETLTVDGRAIEIGPHERDWLATMVREYVRRSGTNAVSRARTIVATSGSDGALREAAAIPRADIRLVYLVAGFAAVSDSVKRVTYVRDGIQLLNDEYARANFLTSIPAVWRNDRSVLSAVYDEAARIRADGAILLVVSAVPPPRPLPLELREPVRALIAGIRNSEQRAEMRARYFESPR